MKTEGMEEPIISDWKDALKALNFLHDEMNWRYLLFNEASSFNIEHYNSSQQEKIPYIVVLIDEYADLITALGEEFEKPLLRLARLARAVGIHIIISTQRHTLEIVTGRIHANFPAHIIFKIECPISAKLIVEAKEATILRGRGDMLFNSDENVIKLQLPYVGMNE